MKEIWVLFDATYIQNRKKNLETDSYMSESDWTLEGADNLASSMLHMYNVLQYCSPERGIYISIVTLPAIGAILPHLNDLIF